MCRPLSVAIGNSSSRGVADGDRRVPAERATPGGRHHGDVQLDETCGRPRSGRRWRRRCSSTPPDIGRSGAEASRGQENSGFRGARCSRPVPSRPPARRRHQVHGRDPSHQEHSAVDAAAGERPGQDEGPDAMAVPSPTSGDSRATVEVHGHRHACRSRGPSSF
jgi:hypothetical protein